MSPIENIIFIQLFVIAIIFFLWNIFRITARICLGRWENRFDRLWSRFRGMLVYGFGQGRVIKEKYGFNHFFIFWGFMVLISIYLEFILNGIFPQFSYAFIPRVIYHPLILIADVMSLVVVVAVIIALIRRIFFRPEHIELTADSFFILALIMLSMLAYFGMHVFEPGMGAKLNHLPVSKFLSANINIISHDITRVCWWIHAVVFLFFLNYLPYSKHMHVLTAIPACFFKAEKMVSTVPRLNFRPGEEFGVSKIVQFKWKDLLDFMACTECGRCQSVCPAYATDKPLNPRKVIHQGKVNIMKNGDAVRATRPCDMLAPAPKDAKMKIPLINDQGEESIASDTIWSCTTCGACMEACPVFIEHVPKIIQMRQHLVMEKSEFPEEVTTFFENSEQRSNPWGMVPTDRVKWAESLDAPLISDGVKPDYLFYVGCAGSFDSRARNISIALTKIFKAANISWAVLGNEETCCGDSLRRTGNEYVFDKMAKTNMETFKKYNIKKIITSCPHCFSTLKNDYKQYGADYSVIHHTEFIMELLKMKKLTLSKATREKIVIHDSCYLGRYNNIYKEPREIIKSCTGGKAPAEMERNREKSFCCGAGGGLVWMEETIGKRIYLERTQEALKKNPEIIAVACPYCKTMFDDGINDERVADKVKVKDIAEIVAEAL